MLPNDGMLPLRRLPATERNSSRWNLLKRSGMSPEKLFMVRSRWVRFGMSGRVSGMGPVKKFSAKSRYWRC